MDSVSSGIIAFQTGLRVSFSWKVMVMVDKCVPGQLLVW